MKKIISLFLFVILVIALMCSFASAETNPYDRKTVRPAWCPNMVTVSSNTGTGGFVLTLAANTERIGGYVINLGSWSVRYSGTQTTTTTIVANGGILGPKRDTQTTVASVATSTNSVSVSVDGSTTTTVAESYNTTTTTTITTLDDIPNIFYFRDGNAVYTGPLYFAAVHNEVTLGVVIVEILRQ